MSSSLVTRLESEILGLGAAHELRDLKVLIFLHVFVNVAVILGVIEE